MGFFRSRVLIQPSKAALGRAAALLQQVADGQSQAFVALEEWPLPLRGGPALCTHAWTTLQHFSDDHNIHVEDPEYLASQVLALKRHALQLHQLAQQGV